MKYFIDTEFLEGTQKRRICGIKLPKYFNTKPTIDLISIGIVAEDGREYYAISKDFNLKEAWNRYELIDTKTLNVDAAWNRKYWIRENVLKSIFNELTMLDRGDDKHSYFTYSNFKYLLKKYGKTNKQIAEEIKEFIYSNGDISMHRKFTAEHLKTNKITPQFYGYGQDKCFVFNYFLKIYG